MVRLMVSAIFGVGRQRRKMSCNGPYGGKSRSESSWLQKFTQVLHVDICKSLIEADLKDEKRNISDTANHNRTVSNDKELKLVFCPLKSRVPPALVFAVQRRRSIFIIYSHTSGFKYQKYPYQSVILHKPLSSLYISQNQVELSPQLTHAPSTYVNPNTYAHFMNYRLKFIISTR